MLFDITEGIIMNYYYERAQNKHYARIRSCRRAAYIRKRIMMMIIFVSITFITLLSVKHLIYANDAQAMPKKFQSVMIYCGDSIDSICSEYSRYGYSAQDSFRNEILSINNISENTTLIAGNYLILPYYEGN